MCNCDKPRLVDVSGKCNDMVSLYFAQTGKEHEGYILPELGIGSGDYIDFTFCLGCGYISGTWPKAEEVEETGCELCDGEECEYCQ